MSTKRKIIKATAIIFLFSIVGKALGFVREILVAARFGTTAGTDAYFVGLTGPDFIREIISGGVLTAVFVPAYARTLKNGSPEEAARFFNTVATLLIAALCSAVAVGMLFPGIVVRLVAPELAGETLREAVQVTRIIFPAILFMGLASLYGNVLNIHERFIASSTAQTFLNIGIIGGVISLSGVWGIRSIAAGFLLGAVLQWAVLIPSMKRLALPRALTVSGLRDMGPLFTGMLPLFLASILSVANDIVSRGLAAGLDVGSVSALNFANRLRETPWLFCAVPLATAAFPFLSRNADQSERKKFTDILDFAIRLAVFLAVPLCAVLFVFNVPIIRILFERGAFTAASTVITANALQYASIGAVFYALNYIVVRAFYSTQRTGMLVVICGAAVMVNAVAGYALRGPMGVGGVAVARSLSDIFVFFALLAMVRTFVPEVSFFHHLRYIVKTGALAAACAVLGWIVYAHVPGLSLPGGGYIRTFAGALVLLGAYGMCAWAAHNREMRAFVRIIREKILPSS